MSGKSVYELVGAYSKLNPANVFKETIQGTTMKFKSNKYRNAQISCGNTLFKFDADGFCEIPGQGYCFSSDVQLLIDRGWLEKVEEDVIPAEVSDPVVDKWEDELKKGIDSDLVAPTDTLLFEEVVDKSEIKLENISEDKPVKSGKKKDKKEV